MLRTRLGRTAIACALLGAYGASTLGVSGENGRAVSFATEVGRT